MAHIRWFSFAFAVLWTAHASAAEWETYQSTTGKFSVLLPGKPQESKQNVGGVEVIVCVLDSDDGAMMVISNEIPAEARANDDELQKYLDGSRDGLLLNLGAKVGEEQRIKLADKYPGRAIQGDVSANPALKDGGVRIHLFAVESRDYGLIVVGKKSFVESDGAGKFLGSLKAMP